MPSTALSRAQARRLRALHQRRHREESGLFLAEGIRVLEDLAASPLEIDCLVAAPSLGDSERARNLLARFDAPLYTTTESELAELAGTETPQGILACVHAPRHALPPALPENAVVLVLDGIQDPGNFGTLVRGADAFGVALVVGLPGTVDFWNPKAVRSAAGSSFRLPLVSASEVELGSWCAAAGVTLWGAEAGGTDVALVRMEGRRGLVLGNEGAGLRPGIRAQLAGTIAIPIRGGAESLNVAMAGTVLMYLLTQR